MNGYVSRPRLAVIVICLTVLAVAGIAHSEQTTEELCLDAEALHFKLSIWMGSCANPQECAEGQEELDSLECTIANCWDLVDGVCSIAAA